MSSRVVSVALMFALVVACGGEDGTDGEDGVSWLTAAVPAASADCPSGGTTVQVGPDSNRNGTLDASEVASSSDVCDGADGDPSDLWLVATQEADTDRCAWGGTILHVGKDTDGSEVLEPAEFLSTQPICKSPVVGFGRNVLFTGRGANNRLSNPDNWDDGTVPLEGDGLIFPQNAAQQRLENDFPLVSTFALLTLQPGIELFGKKMALLDAVLANSQDATVTRIELPLVLQSRPVTFTVAHAGTGVGGLTVSGAIEGFGSITKAGNGTLILSGVNTYRGDTHVAAGTLSLVGGAAVPDSSLFTCNASDVLVDAAGETLASLDGDCDVDLAGPLTVGADAIDSTHEGAMSGPGTITKRGSGVVAFTGNGVAHTGPLLIEQGSVLINGSYGATAVAVSAGATLAGSGNPGPITVAPGGRVVPGVPSTAILTASGNITLASGSTLAIKINGVVSSTGYDRLAANGDIVLGGATLTVDMGFTAALGNTFTIVQCTGALTGTFDGLADGAAVVFEGQRFVIDYTSNGVVLTRADP